MFAAYGQQMPAKPTQSEPAKPEAGPGREKQPKTELEASYDGGFYIRGKDVKFTIEGVLQMNAVAFEPVKLNYLRTMYAQSITINGVSHDHENALMVQFQIQF